MFGPVAHAHVRSPQTLSPSSLRLAAVPERPWNYISMDLLSSYLRLTPNAFTAILVVIDRLPK
jgi:hypothetical protein